jgi:glycosyltransferase involved in cell wall biosynthesis
MRVYFFWEPVGGLTLKHRCNPYAGLLAQALRDQDIELELGDNAFEKGWLEAGRADHDVLHLNWLHYFYRGEDLESTVERYLAFAENLTHARSIGYRIVWTMHNIYPHERPFPEVDRLARLLVCRLAHGVIAHCQHAADLARRLFYREDGLHVVPHGHFIDVFQNEISRREARDRLQVPQDAFVYLFFGNARAYKGVEELIQAFSDTAAEDAVLLLMMRRSFDTAYADSLKEAAAQHDRVHMATSPFFANEDFQVYLNASDVVVLPFTDVLTSGSAIAALSFGKPVVLPKRGCLPELVDATMGILYDPGEPEGLARALTDVRQRDLAAAGRAAYNRAQSLDWGDIAKRVAQIYRG